MEDWGVSIYRLAAGSGANRFGGPKGARRPLAEIRKEIAAAQLAAWQKEKKRVSKRIFFGRDTHTHTQTIVGYVCAVIPRHRLPPPTVDSPSVVMEGLFTRSRDIHDLGMFQTK